MQCRTMPISRVDYKSSEIRCCIEDLLTQTKAFLRVSRVFHNGLWNLAKVEYTGYDFGEWNWHK